MDDEDESFRTRTRTRDPKQQTVISMVHPEAARQMAAYGAAKQAMEREANSVANPVSKIAGNSSEKAAAGEENATSNFANNVAGKSDKSTKKGGFSLKKHGAMGLIGGMLITGAFGIFGATSMLPFAILERFTESFDTKTTGLNLRSRYLTKYQIKNPSRNSLFNDSYYKLSTKQRTKLAAVGFELDVDDRGFVRSLSLDGGNPIDADHFFSNFTDDIDFRTKYTAASRTWSGRVSGYFDYMASRVLNKNGITRDLFKNWIDEQDRIHAETKKWKQAVNKAKTDDFDTPRNNSLDPEAIEDNPDYDNSTPANNVGDPDDPSDDIPRTRPAVDPESPDLDPMNLPDTDTVDGIRSGADVAEVQLGAVGKKAAKVNGIASLATTACMAKNIVMAISAVIAASSVMKILGAVGPAMEALTKTKMGGGDASPTHNLLNTLTTVAPNIISDSDGGNIRSVVDENAPTPMEADPMLSVMTGSTPNRSDPGYADTDVSGSFKEWIDGVSKVIGGLVDFSATSMMVCAGLQIAAGVASMVATISGFVTFGIGTVIKVLADIGGGVMLENIIGNIISVAVSKVAQQFVTDNCANLDGKMGGFCMVAGAGLSFGSINRSMGVPGDRQQVAAYYRQTQEYIALEAEYDRVTKSPFDTTTSHTFLGSILASIAPYTTKFSSITGILSSVSNIVSKSVATILPSANALDETSFMSSLSTPGDGQCPSLDSIGVVGDAFCNPMYISSKDTKALLPEDIYDTVKTANAISSYTVTDGPNEQTVNVSASSFFGKENISEDSDSEVGYKVNNGSELSKFINFCMERQSSFGTVDANIMGSMSSITGNDTADMVIGNVPLIDDIQQIIESGKAIDAIPWANGQNCVASSENHRWSGEIQYYQQFVEDQRILEASGQVTKSAVTAYLEEQERLNPTDYSFEGTLARMSGQTLETTKEVIALLVDAAYPENKTYVASLAPAGNSWTELESSDTFKTVISKSFTAKQNPLNNSNNKKERLDKRLNSSLGWGIL